MDEAEKQTLAARFYNRQIILKEFGQKGQDKLAKSKIAIVGVGGLGTVSSLYLTLAGVGYIRLIDQDIIETQNLHRQMLYSLDDLNYPKTEIAAKRLEKLNPLIKIETAAENLNAENVERLFDGVDCVVDGLDNMMTRYLINRACVKKKIPYVFGAAIGVEGNLSVFSPPETGCLECLLPNLKDNELLKCDTRGVMGAAPGIIGSMQAMETIKVLSGMGSPLKGRLLVCDFSDMYFTTIEISKNNKCPACQGDFSSLEADQRLVWLCGRDTANINPEKPLPLKIDEVYLALNKEFQVRLKSRLALMFNYENYEVSLFNGGRMLIKGIKDRRVRLKFTGKF